jgi:hypothetical protein
MPDKDRVELFQYVAPPKETLFEDSQLTGTDGRERENPMKKVFRIAVAVALLVTLAAPAMALAAQGASATPFKATYAVDETLWTCTGVRIVTGDVVRDEEVCLLSGDTSWVVPGTYTGDPQGDVPPFDSFWGSDYDGAQATSWTFVVGGNEQGVFALHIAAKY